MKILIATGIYPPDIGGPAQYAKNLYDVWSKDGHRVKVKSYRIERALPTGIRHLYYLIKIIPSVIFADFIFALDTFSVGLPAVILAKIFRKKFIIRTGGDFLWESYVERTGEKIKLSEFYKESIPKFSFKERLIFKSTKFVFDKADRIIWSTEWQRDIFKEPYKIDLSKSDIVENFYGPKETLGVFENSVLNSEKSEKLFLGATRKLVWKNTDLLTECFKDFSKDSGIVLDIDQSIYSHFMDRIKDSYATILVSLGDISPNLILDSIRYNKPFILTKENGLIPRIGEISILVDPLNKEEIISKIKWLSDPKNYAIQKAKIEKFNFTHDWIKISSEILEIYKKTL